MSLQPASTSRSLLLRVASLVALAAASAAGPVEAQAPLAARKIGELDLSILGVSATVDPPNPVVPKNTASGVRIVVRAGGGELSLADVTRFLGSGFEVQGELSGPGLATTITIPQRTSADPLPADPLLLPLPGLPVAGDYDLTNLRIVSGGRSVLEVDPSRVVVQVIDQILVTSVITRPLTLDEIRARGIDLSSGDNYLGFAFTLGLKLESQAVTITLPVVFDRQGNVVPEPLQPLPAPPRVSDLQLPPLPTIVPLLLQAEGPADGGPPPSLMLPGGFGEARIPSLLVIPGNVGYLKQFFSAQLFVANGAPVGSGLVVKNVFGKVRLPLGPDGVRGTNPDSNDENDDPLSLPDLVRDGQSVPHPEELPVLGLGPDGAPGTSDDAGAFKPAEQGMADFSIRGDREGFHTIDFDIRADLEGLPVGPVKVKGKARGGVLVRNPYFDLSFTAPSVVRTDETFRLFVTVTNIGQGAANLLSLNWDNDALSGLGLAPGETGERRIDTLAPGDSTTFDFEFLSLRTGQVVASYLRFDTDAPDGSRGDLRFKVGIGERGVPLSPDTLVLPTSVDLLPDDVVRAAMRVLGQAWSLANAPAGTLPAGVLRTSRALVTQKALALAEAGLRVRLGQDALDAVRDLAYDFWSGTQGPDPGFDQLLRTTEAGRGLALAIGAALADRAGAGSGPLGYERKLSRVLASGPDFLAFAVADGTSGARVHVTVQDGAGRRTLTAASPGHLPRADIPGAALVPLGPPSSAPLLGLLTAPTESLYVIELTPITDGPVDFSLTWPGGDGTVRRGSIQGIQLNSGERAWVRLDRQQPDVLRLHHDLDGDGLPEKAYDLAVDSTVRFPEGPGLVSARIVGPETLDGASPFGVYVAFLFDRVVDAASAAVSGNYQVPSNKVQSARRQLSGRLVFASLDQPEGNYVPAHVTADGIADGRGTPMPSAATVELLSLVEDPGAVVTGRVINGDGSPLLPGVIVTYLNNKNTSCLGPVAGPISALPVDGAGQFEFRYVRQDNCGTPFELLTQDPTTRAVRKVSAFVRGPAERIVLDIALFAKGSIVGQVTRFVSAQSQETVPAPGVQVVAVSVTDPQSGGAATTGGDGRYEIDGITVGPVNVRAGGTSGVGGGSGVIQRPGQPAVVNILLDDDAARIHGTVRKIDLNEPDPARQVSVVPGLQVLYYLGGTLLAATDTDAGGDYAFDDVPVGEFTVRASLNTRDRGSFGPATASKGDDVRADINIEIPRDDSPGLGTVRGQVFFADGTPAGDVIVSVNERAVLSVKDEQAGGPPVGTYEIPGVPVRTGLSVVARTRDGKRSAFRSFVFPPEPSPAVTVDLTLSDLGEAHFTVLDPAGFRLPKQQVFLQGICLNPCGCAVAETGPNGEPAVFRDLRVGTVDARVFRPGTGFMDVASASATVRGSAPGQEGRGTLQFAGAGSVFGAVYDPPQTPGGPPVPSHGAEVTLTSKVFINDGARTCDLVAGPSHRTRTAQDGTFSFTAVNVGSVSLAARSDFLNKTVGAQGTILRDGQALGPFTLQFVDTIAGVLSGVVTLPDGLTPAGSGVEVTVNGPLPDVTVKTNADSTYRFPELLPEGSYTITAREPQTGLVARGQVYLRAGQDASYPIRLEGRGTVRVRVVDGADAPVSQAVVKLKETDFPGNSYDGLISPASDGAVTFANVFEGGVSVEVSDAFGRGGRASGIVPTPGPDSVPVEIKVRITTTGNVTGRFLMPAPAGAEGPPIPFGTVRLLAGGRTIGQTTTQNAPDPGRFDFSYVPAGDVRLEAQDPLTARTGFSVGKVATEGETVTLDVIAQALGSVTGTVTQNLQPVAFAQVEIVSGTFKASTFTTPDGTYRLDGVPEGRIVVTASGPGGELRGTNSGTLSQEGEVVPIDVALRATGHVQGNVVAAGGGPAPLCVVTIQVGGVGGGTQTTTTREADGFFEFAKVPAGLATLTVDALGSIDQARRTVDVPAQGTVTLTVELNGVGAIDAQVVEVPDGYAADVVINGTGGFPYQFVASPFPNPNGSFRLPEVLAGPFTASLRTSSGPLRLFGSLSSTVEPGETRAIELTVQPTGTVEGSAYRSDGKPAYGADVAVTTGAGVVSGLVGPDGTFHVEGVLAGSVTARVDDRLTGGVGAASGTVPEGGTLQLPRIDLDDTPISVVGVEPPDGTVGVAVTQAVTVAFSDALQGNPGQGGVRVKRGAQIVSLTPQVSPDSLSVTLLPSGAKWPDDSALTVEATTAVKDVLGRNLLQTFTSAFRTVDLSPPEVVSVVPAHQAVQVDVGTTARVTFDEPLSAGTDVASLVRLSTGVVAVAGTTALVAPEVAVFTPEPALVPDALYTVSVNGAVDGSGNRQTIAFTSTFRTPDTIPPVLALSQPGPGSWVKTARPRIDVTMNDGPVGLGVDPGQARLALDGTEAPATRTATLLRFTPATDLAEGLHAVEASAPDLAGNLGVLAPAGFGVDTVAPGPAALLGVSPGQVVSGTVTLSAAAEDADSGVASFDLLRDGVKFATAAAPSFSAPFATTSVADGPYALAARAADVAGNVGPAGDGVMVVVDNHPLSLVFLAPAAGTRVRSEVVVRVRVSEPVSRVEFSAGAPAVPGTLVSDKTYEAALDLSETAEGEVSLMATAYDLAGGSVAGSLGIVVDRTPPAPPDASRIRAEEADAGFASVVGLAGAVEAAAQVEVTNTGTGASVSVGAAEDGSFAARLLATLDTVLQLVAVDAAGNRSAPTLVVVERGSTRGGVPLEGLALWVSADQGVTADGNRLVSSWADQSEAGNDLVQATAASRPLLVTPEDGFNGWPVLRFDGQNDFVQFTTRLVSVRTVFWVVREAEEATGARPLLGDGSTRDYAAGSSTLWEGNWTSANVRNGQTWVNGLPVDGLAVARPKAMSVVSVVAVGDTRADRFGSGLGGITPAQLNWWGDLAELIVYDRALSPGERQAVEDYLVRKYRPYVPRTGTPAISPSGGVFSGSTTVHLSTTTPDATIRYTLDGGEPFASSPLYEGPFLLDRTATVKARAFREGYEDSDVATATFLESEDAVPARSTGLVLWLRADAGLATNAGPWVSQWTDQSGLGNHALQATGSRLPELVRDAVNGLPALRFDGQDDFVQFTTRLVNARTVFWVVREAAEATGARPLLGDGSTRDYAAGSSTLWQSTWTSPNVRNGQTWVNGLPVDGLAVGRPKAMSVVSVVAVGDTRADRFGSGLGGITPAQLNWWGDLAELVVYDRALSASERKGVEDYLLAKYGVGGRVTAPVVTPHGGLFTDAVSVSVTTLTPEAEVFYTLDGSEPTPLSAPYVGPIVIAETVTLKAKAFRDGLEPSVTVTAGFTKAADFNPRSLEGLRLWLRADAGVPSGAGDFWEDQSGQGNHAVQPAGRSVPVVVGEVVNRLPAMRFDGQDDFVQFTTRLVNARTVFWVVREAAEATGARPLMGDGSTRDYAAGSSTLWEGNWTSASVRNGQTWVNGAPVDGLAVGRPKATSVVSVVAVGDTRVDRFGSGLGGITPAQLNWWGDLAELVVYDRALSASERLAVEDYLNARYQLFIR